MNTIVWIIIVLACLVVVANMIWLKVGAAKDKSPIDTIDRNITGIMINLAVLGVLLIVKVVIQASQ